MSVSSADSFPLRFNAYLKERFPLPAFLPLIILFTCALSYCGQMISGIPIVHIDLHLVLGAIVMLLVFFHLRLFDEFKDYTDDLTEHPDRLVSRGIITLAELRIVTWVTLVLEVVLVSQLERTAQIGYAAMLVFSLLMFKEFFIADFLRRDMIIYAISHQFIILLMAWYGLNIQASLDFGAQPGLLNSMAVMMLSSSFAFELSRKTHDPALDAEGQSYSKYMGWKLLTILVSILFIAAGIAFWFFTQLVSSPPWIWIIQTGLVLVFSAAVLSTGFRPESSRIKKFQLWASLHMLLLYLNLIIVSLISDTEVL